MHYMCLHDIVTKIFDGELKTIEQIKGVFNAAKDKSYDCQIILENGLKYNWVRVDEVKEDGASVRLMLNSGSSLKKFFKFSDIATFVIRSSGEEMMGKSDDVSRWSTLDTVDDDI